MKKKAKWSFLTVLILCVALFLSACGGGQKTTSSSGSSNQKGSKGSGQAAGKPLVMVPQPNSTFQKNFNPFDVNMTGGTNGLIYQPLAYMDLVSGKTYYFLATGTSWSNNNKTMTVTIRNGVKWSDGKPFTADDVVFTFNLLKKYPAADTSGISKELSSVKKVGSNKVAFNFKKPDVPFQSYILQTLIVPKHLWKGKGDPTKAQITNPVGTGPYLLDTFSPSVYTLKANPNYYGGEYKVPELKFPSYSGNDSATLALTNGDVDWASVFIPDADKVYKSKSKNNHYWFPANNDVILFTNLTNSALKQLPVRKAISYAINRQQLSKKAESGFEPAANPSGLIQPHLSKWLDPKLKGKKFTYNQNKAVQILKNAGFKKNSNGIFSKNSKPLSFSLTTVSGWTDWAAMCSLIKGELGKVGIKVQINSVQQAAYNDKMQGKKYQLALGSENAGPSPYRLFNNFLNPNVIYNYEGFNDPKVTQALNAFSKTTDPKAQKQAMYTIEEAVASQLPSIPLTQGPYWYEYSTAKYTGWPNKNNPYVAPAAWAWPAQAVVLSHLKPVQ